MDITTLIFAIVAVVLLARLWSVFGRRNGTDDTPSNPFAMPEPKDAPPEDLKAIRTPAMLLGAPPTSLAGGLESIKTLDPAFDEKAFLQNARATFTMIVEDFAKGDLSRSRNLLGPNVLPHFENAIEARQKAGQSMENRVLRIKDAEVTAAHAEGTRMDITVRFMSEQENILSDSSGRVIGGGEGRVEEIADLWTFARDSQSANANWVLSETRS